MKYMTKEEAIQLMANAIDIHDWNQKREIVKYNINPTVRKETFRDIDCYGLSYIIARVNNWIIKSVHHV